jgi:NADH:ubiquinone oxidoreductase subunit 4 (subunit M)
LSGSILSVLIAAVLFITILIVHAALSRRSTVKSLLSKGYDSFGNNAYIASIFLSFIALLGYALLSDSATMHALIDVSSGYFTYTVLSGARLLKIDVEYSHVAGQSLATMLLIIIAAFYYTVQFSRIELRRFTLYSVCIYASGLLFVATNSIVVMFIAYELILLPTTLVLDYFSKTGRSREATNFMLVWTQTGAILLFFIIGKFISVVDLGGSFFVTITGTRLETNVLIILTFFGFGTKMPIWPFYWWLPEAHVEVSTNFSIVLSGVSIKFAFLGFIRFIELLGNGDVYWMCAVLSLVGLLDAAFKVDTESDIKKIVAYQTVAEMHILVLYVSLDVDAFIDAVMFIFSAHCWISTISFIIVDMISKRYHTRNVEHLYGILAESPRIIKFIFLVVFIFASVPGTMVYSIEFYIQIQGATSPFNAVLFIFVQCFLVVWSKNIWWLLWGGDALYHNYTQPFNMTKSETAFILILIAQLIPTIGITDIISG